MDLAIYSVSDLNMYLRGTFGVFGGVPSEVLRIEFTTDDRTHIEITLGQLSSDTRLIINKSEVLDLVPVTLGYRNTDTGVLFLNTVQRSSYKKLPGRENISVFSPNEYELSAANVTADSRRPSRTLLLTQPTYYTIEDAYDLLRSSSKLAVSLHKNYALVKKGYSKDFIMYYKKDPVAVLSKGVLEPITNQMYIDKFYDEVTTL